MKKLTWLGFGSVTLVLLMVIGGILLSQRQQADLLRSQMEASRADLGEVERLRAENQRLRNAQVSSAELDALRGDHVAVERLRGEVEALRAKAKARE
jgi:Tfp pilus assembly protein PilN